MPELPSGLGTASAPELGSAGPAFGVVFEEEGFDEFAEGAPFVGVELAGGFEDVAESLRPRRRRTVPMTDRGN